MTSSRRTRSSLAVSAFGALALGAAVALAAPPAGAETLTGALDQVENGGRSVVIGGKTIAISGARTNICIAGLCDQAPDTLKAGMSCAVEMVNRDGRAEARRLSCK